MAFHSGSWAFAPNSAVEPNLSTWGGIAAGAVIGNTDVFRLRIALEVIDAPFVVTLEYSSNGTTWTAFGSGALFNYANGLATDYATVASLLLPDTTHKGWYVESLQSPFQFYFSRVYEFDFAIQATGALPASQYTFRLKAGTNIAPAVGYPLPYIYTQADGSITVTGSNAVTAAGTATASSYSSSSATGSAALTAGGNVTISVSGQDGAVQIIGAQAVTGAGYALIRVDTNIGAEGSQALTSAGTAAAIGGADVIAVATGAAALVSGGAVDPGVSVFAIASGSYVFTGAGIVLMEGDNSAEVTGSAALTAAGSVTTAGTATVAASGSAALTAGGSVLVAWLLEGAAALFVNSRGQLEFSRPPRLPGRSLSYDQARVESGGAQPYITDYYRRDELINLPLRLTASEAAGLKTFFTGAAHGRSFPFTFIQQPNRSIEVKFAQTTLPPITEKAYNSYECTLQLRIQ